MDTTARLLITCPDRPGIIAAVTGFLHAHDANVTSLHERATDPEGGTLFMRLQFETSHLVVTPKVLSEKFGEAVGAPYDMDWHVSYGSVRRRTAILVSKTDHCVNELLWEWQRGALHTDVGAVISNHEALRGAAEQFNVPFHHVPFTRETQAESEAEMLRILVGNFDLVILARYMRILSGNFVSHFTNRLINIHHSFLPAFAGANPYKQAYEHGVKIIGATAHYVTEELDAGPIIEQDVARVSYRDSVSDLKTKGRQLERQVLSQAVRWHLEDRIIVHGGKTIVFS